jgi:hypothetical protein
MVTYSSSNKGAFEDAMINETYYAGESAANDGATTAKIVDNSAKDTKLRYPCRYTKKPVVPIKEPVVIEEALAGEVRRGNSGILMPYSDVKWNIAGILESGWLAYLALGTASNAISGSEFVHTITPNVDFGLPSFTRWVETYNARASQSESFKVIGNVINKISFAAKAKELVMVDCECIGKQIIQSTSDLLATENQPAWSNCGLGYNYGSMTITASAGDLAALDDTDVGHAYEFEEFKFTYNNNAQTEQNAGASNSTDTCSDIEAGKAEMLLALKFQVNDRTLINWFNTYKNSGNVSAETKLTIKFAKTAADYIQFDFQRIRFKAIKDVGEDKLEVEAEIIPLENYTNATAADRPAVTITVKDTIDRFNTNQWYPYGSASS